MSTLLWAVGAVVICAVLLYVAYVIEPHWVAKDGSRFLTTSEIVDRFGASLGRRREVRGTIMNDGTILLGKRSLLRTRTTLFRVRGKSPQVSRGRQQYVLEQIPPDPDGDLMILRIPTTSPLTARFDDLAGSAGA
jgi:hypothetical protein